MALRKEQEEKGEQLVKYKTRELSVLYVSIM